MKSESQEQKKNTIIYIKSEKKSFIFPHTEFVTSNLSETPFDKND